MPYVTVTPGGLGSAGLLLVCALPNTTFVIWTGEVLLEEPLSFTLLEFPPYGLEVCADSVVACLLQISLLRALLSLLFTYLLLV